MGCQKLGQPVPDSNLVSDLNSARSQQMQRKTPCPCSFQVTPLKGFYDAESYHQHYADQNPDNPYILVCDRPKIAALKEQFPELFQDYKGK
jgi:peptide methionine sulfoxide reductase MsrA